MSAVLQTPWPELPTAAWRDTYATLQLWTQIVGKIRLTRTPWLNHSWHVTLYVTARGLTTSSIPDGNRTFIISPRDPGLANWVGTAGLHEGWIQIRWQGMPPQANGSELLRSFRLVKLATLRSERGAGLPQRSAAQREAEMNKRTDQWRLRTAVAR